MAERNGSVVRRRVLARQLRLLREESGLTLEAAAPALDWSVSKLSRIETAQQAVDVHGVKSMLDLYDAGGDRWTELVTLAREARQRGWWQAYVRGERYSYVGYETEACRVRDFTTNYVPGLLQLPDYCRALFLGSAVPRSDTELEAAIAVRRIRQERLRSSGNPLQLEAIIDEPALHRPVGGTAVHRIQLDHLLVAADLPTVTLQVVPISAGAHQALASGFTLLSFGDLGEPDLAYVEHSLGAVYIEKEAEVAGASVSFDHLRSVALDPVQSVELIASIRAAVE